MCVSVLSLCVCLCEFVWEGCSRDSNKETVWTEGIKYGNIKESSRAKYQCNINMQEDKGKENYGEMSLGR